MKLLAVILVAFALGMLTEHGLRIYKNAAPVEMPEVPQFNFTNKGWT